MHISTQAMKSGLLGITLLAAIAVSTGVTVAAATSPPIIAPEDNSPRLSTIISKGDQEINRRLTTLGTLKDKINSAAKLTASDKSSLLTEVNNEITGLTNLKAKLDADTTLVAAKADAQSIFNDYRVYALIVPKVRLIKTADDQQVTEAKLTSLAGKLQTRITTAQTNGKDVSSLQAKLNDMKTQITNAQAISSAIEAKVITLQPSDYNSDHHLLSGDAAQLKTAHADNKAAVSDAKSIASALKNL